jgi:hypothetical protein
VTTFRLPILEAFVFPNRRRVLPATGGVAPSVVPITRIASLGEWGTPPSFGSQKTGFQAGGEFPH